MSVDEEMDEEMESTCIVSSSAGIGGKNLTGKLCICLR